MNEHAGHHAIIFRNRFWVSLALCLPVLFFSPMFAALLGYSPPQFPGSAWIAPILGSVVYFYGGSPFLTGGWQELRSRRPGMMLLIAMAITVAFIASWATSLSLGLDLDFWWELVLLVVIMLLGHWMEMRALGAASGALDELATLLPDDAERLKSTDGLSVHPGNLETVPIPELAVGDRVLVRPGGRVPADGSVLEGTAGVDESMLTGESQPVRRGPGSTVVAGAMVTDTSLIVEITAIGEETALAGIRRLVAEAQKSSSRAQALADRAAAFLFYFAAGAALITFLVWIFIGSSDDAITRTVTVLVIACPHALGLAIPLVIAISTERAARAGVLVRNRIALEKLRTVDVVLFDKTGTLTQGRPEITEVATIPGMARQRLLGLAAAAESQSEHPLARAVVAASSKEEENPDAPAQQTSEITAVRSMTGLGVAATVSGQTIEVGGPALLRHRDAEEPTEITEQTSAWIARGAAVLYVLADGQVIGALGAQDAIRAESAQAVRASKQRGIEVAMITGDARQVAADVAAQLGIEEVFAEVLPADKDEKVALLQARGKAVAMVGDGVNDSPALARADVGIAIGAGSDIAVASAGIVLAGDDPRAVPAMIGFSRASYRKMWQNLVWATGYNLISVPLAAGVLAFAGFVLSPAAGAILMSLSTIVVALNAQLLRRVTIDPEKV
ncbi:heavy metal translocating P-type ATPase [Acaricomes phytoseiuli]|uniref:heavy metal translocating P-type ATPase n=1 Tax=Acaricomes phytoseiuli TaxID=291968 RepID=UPI0003738240|nr:heavy metal translocating P-type ATPase [Acaricomes phytoseiuli]